MKLRTAHCLNALFQRRDATRLLNTFYSRIGTATSASNENHAIVHTPGEAAAYLSAFLESGNATFDSPLTFVIEGLIHDPFARTDRVVEALNLKFPDAKGDSVMTMDEGFLKGLVHCDSMPCTCGPDIGAFIATLRCAGDSWGAVDFLYTIARRQQAA